MVRGGTPPESTPLAQHAQAQLLRTFRTGAATNLFSWFS
jgi:hypothetical protein